MHNGPKRNIRKLQQLWIPFCNSEDLNALTMSAIQTLTATDKSSKDKGMHKIAKSLGILRLLRAIWKESKLGQQTKQDLMKQKYGPMFTKFRMPSYSMSTEEIKGLDPTCTCEPFATHEMHKDRLGLCTDTHAKVWILMQTRAGLQALKQCCSITSFWETE